MKKPVYLHLLIDLPEGTVLAYFRYWPARKPAHAGADSPRYLDPGFPGRIDDLHLFEDWIDKTDELDSATLSAIKAAIWEAVRLSPLPVRIRSVCPNRLSYCSQNDQLPLGLERKQEATP